MARWLLNAIGAVVCGGVVYAVSMYLFHIRKAQGQRLWLYVTIGILLLELLWQLFGTYGPGGRRGISGRPKRG